MRPSLNVYNPKGVPSPFYSPHLDKLAATGTLFTRAYIQFSHVILQHWLFLLLCFCIFCVCIFCVWI
jgi:type II secretory pathway component PulF